MTRRIAIQTPFATDDAIELGNNTWRKQVLRFGDLPYEGRVLTFNRSFADGLVEAFNADAFDSVPFVFADADNSHTQAVERARGSVTALEATDDGLDAIFQLSEEADQLVRDHPRMGVSVRVLPQRTFEGVEHPNALQHVLATFDPRITGMRPWEAVDLSHDTDAVIDLSQTTADAPTGRQGGDTMSDTTHDVLAAAFATFLRTPEAQQLIAASKPAATETPTEKPKEAPEGAPADAPKVPAETPKETPAEKTDGTDGDMPTDEEIAAIVEDLLSGVQSPATAAVTAPETTPADTAPVPPAPVVPPVVAPQPVAASNTDTTSIELSRTVADQQEQIRRQGMELARIRAERDTSDFLNLRSDLARGHGIPTHVTDVLRPLLIGNSHEVQLSNGTNGKVREIVLSALRQLGDTYRALDLSNPTGSDFDVTDTPDDAAKARDERARAGINELGL